MTQINYREIKVAVRKRVPFDGNTMSAELVAPGQRPKRGILPQIEVVILMSELEDAKRFDEPVYVVYSYDTPIAWGLNGRDLYVPDVRYSITTSRHQGIVRREGKA